MLTFRKSSIFIQTSSEIENDRIIFFAIFREIIPTSPRSHVCIRNHEATFASNWSTKRKLRFERIECSKNIFRDSAIALKRGRQIEILEESNQAACWLADWWLRLNINASDWEQMQRCFWRFENSWNQSKAWSSCLGVWS